MTNPVFHRFRWQGSRYSTVYEPFIPVFHRFHRFEFFHTRKTFFWRRPNKAREKQRLRSTSGKSHGKHRGLCGESHLFLSAAGRALCMNSQQEEWPAIRNTLESMPRSAIYVASHEKAAELKFCGS
jgi:hypothetical protein